MPTYEYPAVFYKQTANSKAVVLFSAPFNEILSWAGIPRKEEKEGTETIGFQRQSNKDRVKNIGKFLGDDENVIANPVLCAIRGKNSYEFLPFNPDFPQENQAGVLKIIVEDFTSQGLKDLLMSMKALLENRSPKLLADNPEGSEQYTGEDISVLLTKPKSVDSEDGEEETLSSETSDAENSTNDDVEINSDTHIDEFYQELLRSIAALEASATPDELSSVGGFNRTFAIDYLKAATVVDGQHRLLGAEEELKEKALSAEWLEMTTDLIEQGLTEDEIRAKLSKQFARRYGVSLILNPDWAEHVFQFVVVNQKATPISKPLLSSIVATTLTTEEIDKISGRLTEAGIQVADFVTLSYLSRAENSPFKDLIVRGYGTGNEAKKLDQSVVTRLVTMFRDLKGGVLFHEGSKDYAENWRREYLSDCALVADYEAHDYETAFEYWKSPEGPWRDVFIKFWSIVRDEMANTEDEESGNYWGNVRHSNLFNGVQLTILGADFFKSMYDGERKIDSLDDLDNLVKARWLKNINGRTKGYFDRNWNLSGRRKTEPKVMFRLAQAWDQFRFQGRLPTIFQNRER